MTPALAGLTARLKALDAYLDEHAQLRFRPLAQLLDPPPSAVDSASNDKRPPRPAAEQRYPRQR